KLNFTELLNLNEKSFIILTMRASPLFYCLFVISIITNLKLFFYTLTSLPFEIVVDINENTMIELEQQIRICQAN
ncbi:MAG: hypothetical protein Q4D76_17395, partial [Oscillospiraceae bacterium]|nr:hypothetical protein [Oscillospiraceae bacterium]